MTDIKEPINTTSNGTFLSVVCGNPKKGLLAKSWGGGGLWPPKPPPGITPLHYNTDIGSAHKLHSILPKFYRTLPCSLYKNRSDSRNLEALLFI